jgi:hypothetical protein
LALLHEDLASVFASIFTIQRRNAVLLGVMTLLEWLKGSHEIMSTSDTMGDDTLSNTGSDGTLDNSSDRVHGSDNLGLELWWHVKLNLLEEILGSTETTNDKNVLQSLVSWSKKAKRLTYL